MSALLSSMPRVPADPRRVRAARAAALIGTAMIAAVLHLAARADERYLPVDVLLGIAGVVAALLLVASTAGTLWPMGVFGQQALISAPLMMVAIALLPRDGDPLRTVDIAAIPIGGLIWACVLGGIQIIAWQPGAHRRLKAYYAAQQAEQFASIADLRAQLVGAEGNLREQVERENQAAREQQAAREREQRDR